MSEDRSWGADTVAFGRASREPSRPAPLRPRPTRPKLPTIALRPLALVTVAIVAVVALVIAVGSGSDSQKAPIRDVADPAPRVRTQAHRREPRRPAKPRVRRVGAGQLERKHELKPSAPAQAQDAPEAAPNPPVESAPQYAPPPAPEAEATPAPTPPAVEFGL